MKRPTDNSSPDRFEQARRELEAREKGYRERALRIFPWICSRCGREFSGSKLRELTVHHKDHDHGNNPPDGSNWELLCNWCHDDEHTRGLHGHPGDPSGASGEPGSTHRPFGALGDLLKERKKP
jgi:5-methylcytosine-specific restriction endonuclease McrA